MKKLLVIAILIILCCTTLREEKKEGEGLVFVLNYMEFFTDDPDAANLRSIVNIVSDFDTALIKKILYNKYGIVLMVDDFVHLQELCKVAIDREIKIPNNFNSLDRYSHQEIPIIARKETPVNEKIIDQNGKRFLYEYYTWRWAASKEKFSAKLLFDKTIYDIKNKRYGIALVLTENSQILFEFASNSDQNLIR